MGKDLTWHIGQFVFTSRDGQNFSLTEVYFFQYIIYLLSIHLGVAQIMHKREIRKGVFQFYVHFKESVYLFF